MKKYKKNECAVFFKVSEKFGELSNMSHRHMFQIVSTTETGEFAFAEDFTSSEILYQALKFSEINAQRKITDNRNSISAKKLALSTRGIRENWKELRIDAMRFALFSKFAHSKELISILFSTGNMQIVEKSYKDVFWGAKPMSENYLVGENVLGTLLTEMRDSLIQTKSFSSFLEPISEEFQKSEFLGYPIKSYLW